MVINVTFRTNAPNINPCLIRYSKESHPPFSSSSFTHVACHSPSCSASSAVAVACTTRYFVFGIRFFCNRMWERAYSPPRISSNRPPPSEGFCPIITRNHIIFGSRPSRKDCRDRGSICPWRKPRPVNPCWPTPTPTPNSVDVGC